MITAEHVRNFTTLELINHTQHLIDNGNYEPMLSATLERLLNSAVLIETLKQKYKDLEDAKTKV